MVQQILDDIRAYFEAKTSLTPQEQDLLQRLNEGFYPVALASRENLQSCGFDTRSITDTQMRELAKRMRRCYGEQFFLSNMEAIAEALEFPYYPVCPLCSNPQISFDKQTGTLSCDGCGQEWHEHLYVLVEFPDDTSCFEEEHIGYPSSEGRARYVPEYDYIECLGKDPEPNRYFKPLRWPESQPYLFPDEPDEALDSLNEAILDERGIKDFGENAVWVPLCNLKDKE